jgi:DNA-binding transcriptional LysR family regulator
MSSPIDPRQLECFLAVAETRHFRRAADHLHLGPATVTESVAALERRLGGRLFDRTTRRVELTDFGERFLNDVKEPYEQVQRAVDSARRRSPAEAGLVIAYTPELGQLYLPAIVRGNPGQDAASGPPWRPVLMHTTEQLREVEAGSVDLGLCWSATVRRPLSAITLADVPVVAVLRSDDPLAELPAIPLATLRLRRLLTIPHADNPFIESRLRAGLVQVGISTTDIGEVARYDELVVGVATSNRVGLHPGTISMTNRIPGVTFRRVVDPDLTETVSVLVRGPRPAPELARLIDVITAATAELDLDALFTL